MRTARPVAMMAVTIALLIASLAAPAAAQQSEAFPGPGDTELEGYTRSDGTVVLTDAAFCSFLLGSIWPDDQLTFADLLDRSKKQKRARRAAFAPGQDGETVERCAATLAAYRTAAPDEDTIVAWARRSPVVPEALASLLPSDFIADPPAQSAPVLEAARTSGFGTEVTAPFLMEEETWLVQVDAVDCSAWSGSLRNARDAEQVIAVTDNREYLYNVVPGHYYWDVTAPDCDWSVDLAPVPIGPDPDATPVPRVAVPSLAPENPGEDWFAGRPNERYLTASQARQALLDVGLTVGACVEQAHETVEQGFIAPGRVWAQDPAPGTLLPMGTGVEVTAVSDCDVVLGDRVVFDAGE